MEGQINLLRDLVPSLACIVEFRSANKLCKLVCRISKFGMIVELAFWTLLARP